MEYKRVYNSIVKNRRKNPLPSSKYGEWHHIVPKSLGGSDDPSNLVRLSAREHFICHALLAEMYEEGSNEWYKMNHAFMMMRCNSDTQNRYMNSRLYELKRKDFSKAQSWSQTGKKNSQYGRPRSKETREKISESQKRNYVGKQTWLDKKQQEREKELRDHTTEEGLYFNKYRRKKVKEIFDINLEEDFEQSVEEFRTLLKKLYNEERLSTVEIGKKFKTSNETVRQYLKLFNIKRRTYSESLKNYCNNHTLV